MGHKKKQRSASVPSGPIARSDGANALDVFASEDTGHSSPESTGRAFPLTPCNLAGLTAADDREVSALDLFWPEPVASPVGVETIDTLPPMPAPTAVTAGSEISRSSSPLGESPPSHGARLAWTSSRSSPVETNAARQSPYRPTVAPPPELWIFARYRPSGLSASAFGAALLVVGTALLTGPRRPDGPQLRTPVGARSAPASTEPVSADSRASETTSASAAPSAPAAPSAEVEAPPPQTTNATLPLEPPTASLPEVGPQRSAAAAGRAIWEATATIAPVAPADLPQTRSVSVTPVMPAPRPAVEADQAVQVVVAPLIGSVSDGAEPVATSLVSPPAAVSAERPSGPRPPAPVSVSLPAPAEAGASSAAVRLVNDDRAVRTALEGYRTAYNQLNVSGAKAVWPTVDVATLAKAFGQLESQDIEFTGCRVDVTGDRAQAACGGSAAFVPKIGRRSPRRTSREWRFALERWADRWVIVRTDTR